MRKSWINTVLIIVLCMLLASCKSPEKVNQPKTDNPDVSVTDKNTDEVKKEESKTPAPEMLEGEWILGNGMIEGEVTLIGEDKLLIKHIYIIDHYDESMGMSYAFYDRK